MHDPVALIIDGLAVFRLSRLIVADEILRPIREWLWLRWPGDNTEFYASAVDRVKVATFEVEPRQSPPVYVAARPSWLGRWLECVWCVSMWIAPAVVTMRALTGWWQWPATMLALSAVAGILHVWSYSE
jgi:hypothetical protein